jgi:anhydro-N-acetylmuramic acid kinase
MSGTSLDGIDVASVRMVAGRPQLELFQSHPFSAPFRRQLRRFLEASTCQPCEFIQLHVLLGELLADACACLLAEMDSPPVEAIGIHGVTFWHQVEGQAWGSFQLGDGNRVAARLGLPVVADFRNADMALGGQGAPLVPYLDRLLFQVRSQDRLLINLGGIANVSFLPAARRGWPLLAFDTGPANMLLDALVHYDSQGRLAFDAEGALARSGRVDGALLAELLAHPYFARPAPKSTGRETFGRQFLDAFREGRCLADQLATALELTALSLSQAIAVTEEKRYGGKRFNQVFLSGGGVNNSFLCERLRQLNPGKSWHSTAALGLDPQAKEAVLMAVLAHAHLRGIAGNLPEVTGASRPVVLGLRTG